MPATARSSRCGWRKVYRAWGADIGPDHSPLMAGLGWAVKLRKNIPFLGREALEAQRAEAAAAAARRLHRRRSGRRAARPRDDLPRTASASAGCPPPAGATRSSKNIGLGYVRDADGVDADYVMSGDYELEVATERVPAKAFLKPLYDPEMQRVKA